MGMGIGMGCQSPTHNPHPQVPIPTTHMDMPYPCRCLTYLMALSSTSPHAVHWSTMQIHWQSWRLPSKGEPRNRDIDSYWHLYSFKVKHAIAFDAPHLQATLTAEFLLQLTRHTVLHRLDFTMALKNILPDISELGQHSSIIHFVDGKKVQYTWAHRII